MAPNVKVHLILLFQFIWLTVQGQPYHIISWNIRDFGQSRSETEIDLIADILQRADVVAIQEVVAGDPGGAQAVARLAEELNRRGQRWDYRISDPTNSPNGHIRERYAFLWKTARATLSGRPYLWTVVDREVHREPFLAIFRFQNIPVTIINYHSRTHEDESDPEMEEIEAIAGQLSSFQQEEVLWLGDFNLSWRHPAFRQVTAMGYTPTNMGGKTTLRRICRDGEYLSSDEDNIYYKIRRFEVANSRIIDVMQNRPCEAVEEVRKALSDHLPLEITLQLKP